MWHFVSVLLLAAEILLLVGMVIGRACHKKWNKTLLFLGLVFLMNLALYLVPYLYGILEQKTSGNTVFYLLNSILAAAKLFVGDIDTDLVSQFSVTVPVYTAAYLVGALLALFTTVSTALETFGTRIRNHFRLNRALKKQMCDIVLGDSENALLYARNSGAVVLLEESGNRDRALALMEDGYIVLCQDFSQRFLSGRLLNTATRYHLVCPKTTGDFLRPLNVFVAYQKAQSQKKQLHLYLEADREKAETVCREIIDRNGLSHVVTVFCANELLARTFVEENPVTAYIPGDFICEDASVAADARIQVILLGYGELNREMYHQMVLNNQLVSFRDGQYRLHPVHYTIYDQSANPDEWNVDGLKKALAAMQADGDGFPLPELPYETKVENRDPRSREVLNGVCSQVRQARSYTCVIVDTGDVYSSIETGARLRAMLEGQKNFHLFVRSDRSFTHSDTVTTYYGSFDSVFSHAVIVNDQLSQMAKRINEIYAGDPEKAEQAWKRMDHFTRESNLSAAVNLRVKLNLLGLDYVADGKAEHIERISHAYQHRESYDYGEYFEQSRRNALLAQEHARWNAYHLLSELLPMGYSGITVQSRDGNKVRFRIKDMAAKKHACLTTFRGLDDLSVYLAKTAQDLTGTPHTAAQYDYYCYDEMLITAAQELLTMLGCSVKER